MADADSDVEETGHRGVDAMRDMPHARFDCLIHKFPKGNPTAEECFKGCDKCFCWLCDIKFSECKHWKEHCVACDTPEWASKREKFKKKAEERAATDSADVVNARFAQAAAQADNAAAPVSEQEAARREDREQRAEDEENEDLFAEYQPLHLQGGQPHPDPVVETTSLAFADLPPITRRLELPGGLYEPPSASNPHGGALSKAQLETVAYASQRHEISLPTGERAGFFLGDGVGLGKGRQLAGIVLDNWKRGRKRHLWISVSADLAVDTARDLNDIGAGHIKTYNLTKLPYGKIESTGSTLAPRGVKEGVIFSTYSALMSSSRSDRRLTRLVEWLGGDKAEGCILFDESHKAKHLFPDSGAGDGDDAAAAAGVGGARKKGRPKQKSTKMAQCAHEIQEKCPRARVVYCSATGASSLSNMAYMVRLGLWGSGTAFPSFHEFEKAIGDGGTGAMELVALDMKRRGMYISRQLSFKSATYDTAVVDLTSRQKEMYDEAARFWADVHGCFATALDILNVKGFRGQKPAHPAARVMTHYWGCHQRFFRQMCMAVKVPDVVQRAKAALAENKCVVIGLQTTGESRLNDAVKAGEDLEEFAGMLAVVKFLLSKMPTGDYLGLHPEEDLSDDEEEDDDLMEQARSRPAAPAGRRSRRKDADEDSNSSEDEEDEEDRAFIVDDDEDIEEDEDFDSSEDEDHIVGDRRIRLPAEVKRCTMGQLRSVLRAANVKSQNCVGRSQLLSQLKEVEAAYLAGDGESVASLLRKAGLTSKRARDDVSGSNDAAPSAGRRRLSRAAAEKARANYIEVDDSEQEAEESEADEDVGETSHGLLHQTLDVKMNGSWCTGEVTAAKGGKHKLRFEVGGEETWIDLKATRYRFHTKRVAPGAAGHKRSGKCVIASDDDDEAFSKPVPRNAKAQKSKAKGKRRIVESDSDGSASVSDSSDQEEAPPKRSKVSTATKTTSTKARAKARVKAAADDDVDSLLDPDEAGDEDDDLSMFQHRDPRQIKMLQKLKRTLLLRLKKLRMPDNPLDQLLNELGGPEHVSEMTGRKGRLVRDERGRTVYARRNVGLRDDDGKQVTMEKINLSERKAFMDGKKLVAIISEAASSGISLQADKRVANTRRRVHITLELPWSADQCVQQCGRTHRSNQVHGPEYVLMMTACGGERRFASTAARRLQQLGALTKADRRAADASDLSAFDVDTKWGRKALNEVLDLLRSPGWAAQHVPPEHVRVALGLKRDNLQAEWQDYLEDASDACKGLGITNEVSVRTFLNRLLGMTVDKQNQIFSHFAAEVDEQIKVAKQNDTFDEGVVDIRGESISVSPGFPQVLATDASTSVALSYHRLEVDRGISYDRALQLLNEKAQTNASSKLLKDEGFYQSSRPLLGREKEGLKGCAFLIQKPIRAFALNPVPIFKVYRPGTGLGQPIALSDFTRDGRFVKQEDDELIKKAWTRLYTDAATTCSHGPNCKNRQWCKVGLRTQDKMIVSGAVLPFWAYLQAAVGYEHRQDSEHARVRIISRMRIVRVRFQDANGKEQRLVGIEIATESALKQLVTALSALSNASASSSADVKPNVHGSAAAVDRKPFANASNASASGSAGHRLYPILSKVTIHGLQSESALKFNFCAGTVGKFIQDKGRYEVTIASGQYKGTLLHCKADNLMPRH